jgi:integrase
MGSKIGHVYAYQTKRYGKRWGAVFEAGADWETGRRKQTRKTGFRTKAEADAWLVERMNSRRTGNLVEPSMQPLGAWLKEWLALREPELRAASVTNYELSFRWFAPIHAVPLARLTPGHVERECARLMRAGHKASAVARAKGRLSTALRTAMRTGALATNPAALATGPSAKAERREALTGEQVHRLLDAAGDGQWAVLWRTLLECWLRIGEVIELRWSDLDLERGVLRIERAQTGAFATDPATGKRRRIFVVGAPKTPESHRELPISFDLVRALHAHRSAQKQAWRAEGRDWSPSGLVFPSPTGRWLDRTRINAVLAAHCAEAGIPRIRTHDLRHTGGSLVLHAGYDIKTISERMGHADVATTWRVYMHTNAAQHKRVADMMGELLRAPSAASDETSVTGT